MVVVRYISASIVILLSSSFAVQAKSIKFEEVLTITVAGLDTIRKCDFGNVYYFQDCPEVLASDGAKVVLYSYNRDSVLFSRSIEYDFLTEYYNGNGYNIMLSDIDKDAIADIVIATYNIAYPAFHIFYFSGSGFYGILDSGTVPVAGGSLCEYPFGIMSFDALDINTDGYEELIFSCDSATGGCDIATLYAITRVYYSFPDSLLWQSDEPFSDPVLYTNSAGNHLFVTQHEARYVDLPGYDSYRDIGTLRYIADIKSGGHIKETETDAVLKSTALSGLTEEVDVSRIACIGNIDIGTPDKEILVCRDHYHSYSAYPDTFDYQSYPQLTLIRSIPPATMDTIWSITPEILLTDCVYLPDHPGYFFAFDGDRFVQYRGKDGSEFQSTADVPVGNKKWMYPFNGGQPYLVSFLSNTITIYRPMVITDVGEEADQQLPTALSLGPPHPNPFNASQTIPVKIRSGQPLTVDIYDLLGRRVDRIYSGNPFTNDLELQWNVGALPSGVYFIKATSGNQVAVRKSILLK